MIEQPKTERTFVTSVGWAVNGIKRTYRRQPNFRRELLAGLLAVGLAVWLKAPVAPIVLVCGLVLSLEVLNSAVEALVDLVSPQRQELAGAAKDAAAGAVLIAAFVSVVVGLVVLGPPLWAKLGSVL